MVFCVGNVLSNIFPKLKDIGSYSLRYQIWLSSVELTEYISWLNSSSAGLEASGRRTGKIAALWVPPSGYMLMCTLRIFWPAPPAFACEVFIRMQKSYKSVHFFQHTPHIISTETIFNVLGYHKSFIFYQILIKFSKYPTKCIK